MVRFSRLSLILLCPALVAAKGSEDDPNCGMLPEAVSASNVYSGWSSCRLKRLGEPPLYKGVPEGTKQVIRFTFTHGHAMFFRVVTVTEHPNGTGELRVRGTRNRRDYRENEIYIVPRRVRLTAEDMARISRLGEETGAWTFEVGTWDKNEDGSEDIYMHCQLLEMERANAAGYRFSSVNIGCNQPKKLMPLVDEIVRLAKMKNTANGMLFE